ncbi:unnamed protein product [Trypanosoma congolense IL3000]|uniref:WGS project CAEQ00000000 data, annotated contig 1214 n=1 Tax=Trypanosoma congolense (strain IL3000) TaxID=1068625 RepID=F9W4Q0_TRYCI|nr:unnamed protein product [Trypanosoma congolense IL3000]
MRPVRASAEMERTLVAATSHEVVAQPSVRWTLDNVVEDVLMEDCGGLGDMGLHDFLMEHFGETFGFPSVSMRVFMDDPSFFLRDEPLCTTITNSSPYRQFVREYEKEYAMMREAVGGLHAMGMFSLHQWARAAAANEVGKFKMCVKGKLNAALFIARRNEEAMRYGIASSGKEIDCVYDSVFNARWSYVVRSDEHKEKWLGMGVLRMEEGEQPRLWSEAQADVPYDPEGPWEGDEVPGVSGKLVMAVLSSQRGWPYMLFDADEVRKEKVNTLTGYNAACDAYIRKEDVRVWHIVKKGLDMWMESGRVAHPFFLIGTSGIGKSFATGSLLLYQLLHYPSDDLKVVAYFVRGRAYIFHREERSVVYYAEQCLAVDEIEDLIRRGIKGYIIFDIRKECIGIGSCSSAWGIVLISSPEVDNFQKFTALRRGTLPIYINCYEDVDFKAVLVWERQSQVAKGQIKLEDFNIENDWKVVEWRIHMIGPVPRHVLVDEGYFDHFVTGVNYHVGRALCGRLESHINILSHPYEWCVDDARDVMVKLVRVQGVWPEEARNKAACAYVRGRFFGEAAWMYAMTRVKDNMLVSKEEGCTSKIEMFGIQAFTSSHVVSEIVRHLKYLPREDETERSRTSVLARVCASGCVPTSVHHFSSADTPVELVAERFYKTKEENFPVVGGFFLADAVGEGVSFPEGAAALTRTIVLLQMSGARDPNTTTGKVDAFRKRMAKSFTNWKEMESRLSYEIIYLQHADSTALTGRQCCGRSGVADDTGTEQFWNGIDQFWVRLENRITKLLLQRKHDVTVKVTGVDKVRV